MKTRLQLGDQQAMAYVRIGAFPTGAMADTGSRRSIIGREIAKQAGAVPTGRTGTMMIAGAKMHGEIMRIRIDTIEGSCGADIEAFVPAPGSVFRKGVLLGMDFLQAAKMRIDAETGEAYCSLPRRRRPAKRK